MSNLIACFICIDSVTAGAKCVVQVVLHLYQEALEKVPFFRGQHPQFITSVVTFLKLEYYSPVSGRLSHAAFMWQARAAAAYHSMTGDR